MSKSVKESAVPFLVKKRQKKAKKTAASPIEWKIAVPKRKLTWSNRMQRIRLTRKGVPFSAVEVVGRKGKIPISRMLDLLDLPQTTYNKKKRENKLLDVRDSEILLVLSEVLDFGLYVFNNDREEFHNWLFKSNYSLGGVTPESLFDSVTGIEEVRGTLQRLEYGNLA